MNKRNFIFYVLVLVIIGLSVILVVSKITNKIVIAHSEAIIQDALKDEKVIEVEDEFKDNLNVDGIQDGYTRISLNGMKLINANKSLNEFEILKNILEIREYIDESYHLCFRNGVFTDEEMVEIITSQIDDDNDSNLKISTSKLNEISNKIFSKEVNLSNTNYVTEDGQIDVKKVSYIKDYILKINKVYFNSESNIYDIYIDNIYPSDISKIDEYRSENVIDYMNSEIKNTYKLRVQKVDNGEYKLISLYCYNFKY